MSDLSTEVQRVKTFLESKGLGDRLLLIEASISTAGQTSTTLHIEKSSIAKGILLMTDNKPVLFMIPGNKRVDLKRAQETLQTSEVRLAAPDEAVYFSGFSIKGVSPIAHPTPIPVYIHHVLKQHPLLYVAAGDDHAMFRVTFDELQQITSGIVF